MDGRRSFPDDQQGSRWSDRGYPEGDWRGTDDSRYRDDDFRAPEQRGGTDEGRYADAPPRYGDTGRFGAADPLGDVRQETEGYRGRSRRGEPDPSEVSGELPGERGGRRAARESADPLGLGGLARDGRPARYGPDVRRTAARSARRLPDRRAVPPGRVGARRPRRR
ncbi:hypothetical protein MRQ36_20235 [Micromonospora sp. R77]|uniref:hypothetical protein n=1 Tax=Micromonospora sp. R77 TaxID=2925836 RepID=UPI001F60A927|nr:hypothetical protein [Micromonospora sp. R77]MCI4064769.1 hypothetical protein [Micromonospora sp. R77]